MKKAVATAMIILMFLSVMAVGIRTVGADTNYNLWTNNTMSNHFTPSAYYDTEYFLWMSQTYYVGYITYQYIVDYLPSNSPSYDWYAVYVNVNMNPSKNQGSGTGQILGGNVTLGLSSYCTVVDYDPVATTDTYQYGVTATIGTSSASLGVSSSISVPGISISTNMGLWYWGHAAIWTYSFKDGTQQYNLMFTALIAVQKTHSLQASITVKTNWGVWGWFNIEYKPSYTEYTEFACYQNTPISGGGCPNLLVWNGGAYVDEGLLNIHNFVNPESDVVIYHNLNTTPVRTDQGLYELELYEHPAGYNASHSWINQASLFAVDRHGLAHKLDLVSAYLISTNSSRSGDVLPLLLYNDNQWAQTYYGDKIVLQFMATYVPNTVFFAFELIGHNVK